MRYSVGLVLGFTAVLNAVSAQRDVAVDTSSDDRCAARIDLIILVDGSKSVTQSNFLLIKEWIKNLGKSFKIETGNVQIGVVQYSYWHRWRPMWRQPYIKTEIRLGRYKNIQDFNRAVDRIRYQGYQTFTAHAITKIIDYDFQGRNSRFPEAQRVIILLTDGRATDGRDLPEAVNHAEKDAGAVIFAVGVGDYSHRELLLITRNNENRTFELEDFSELETVVYELPRVLETECDCYPQGSLSNDCDLCTRQCPCKPNVTGRRCDKCADGSYNMTNPLGCMACNCDTRGTVPSVICDKESGDCLCMSGVVGEMCDRCGNGRFGFPACELCQCNGFATKCDKVTGICVKCQQNRAGDHCETCKSGYYMSDDGQCEPCQCNGHIDVTDPEACDPATGECMKCLHNTTGRQCELCVEHYYRNTETGNCGACQCDLIGTMPSTCDDRLCECDQISGQCHCLPGFTGLRCSICESGYWRAAEVEACQPCRCAIAGSDSPVCDKKSGQCVCLPGYAGLHCQLCGIGYYRDEIGDCIECPCELPGTDKAKWIEGVCPCDNITGQCPCLPNVVGVRCDRCAEFHWGYGSEEGCKPCGCSAPGSLSATCDANTGECECLPGYAGAKCDECSRSFFRQNETDSCKACECNRLGSQASTCEDDSCSCDSTSGQCKCYPNVVGRDCSECADGFWNLASGKGCQSCGCHGRGSVSNVCDKATGKCECLPGYAGQKCEKCELGHSRMGAVGSCEECDCDLSGTNSSTCDLGACTCDTKTGQCSCLPNVIGLMCDECADGYWDLGNTEGCIECLCKGRGAISLDCNKTTGECECLPGYSGDHCDECDRGYSRENELACKLCACDDVGTDPKSCEEGVCSCHSITGQCTCLPGVAGVDCSQCKDEFWGIVPHEGCKPCDCVPVGSASNNCSKDSGECECLPGYYGTSCEVCDLGHYRSEEGECLSCDCNLLGTDSSECEETTCFCDEETAQCPCLPGVTGLKCDSCQDRYWNFGSDGGCRLCGCDSTGSFSPVCGKDTGECECLPGYSGVKCEKCDQGYFRTIESAVCKECDCNILGTVISNCEEGICTCDADSGQCECRDHVIGRTCEKCEDGFWNFKGAGGCEACGCHALGSASKTCDKSTGQCDCLPGHTGKQCDVCVVGHARLNGEDVCSECDCDLSGTDPSRCDIGICECDAFNGQCPCLPNVIGLMCDNCEHGYWDFGGDGGCKECQCHGLGSLSQVCDKRTGKCECLPGHTGSKCNECEVGYSRKNAEDKCKECRCDLSGTDPASCEDGFCSCDSVTGQCPCLPGVTGKLCNKCEEEHWGLVPGEGCKSCACNVEGSVSVACDKDTGACDCHPGHAGRKCDQCDRGFFRTSQTEKCQACKCNMYGTDPSGCVGDSCTCDVSSGQCQCLPNVSGLTCDRCDIGFWNIRSMKGCEQCGCDKKGSNSPQCEEKSGQCECARGYKGRDCGECDDDFSLSASTGGCMAEALLNDEIRTTETTTTTTEKTTTTRKPPRPVPTWRPILTRRPYKTPAPRISPSTRCNRCRVWPSYCYGWMCRRRWPHHKFTPSPRRCGYGHASCQYNVANRYGQYSSRRTTPAPRARPTSRPFYGYSLYSNSGYNYMMYPRRTYSRQRYHSSSRSRSGPVSYGLYRSLYGGK